MCMRLGADSGRNFLSTTDPVGKDKKSSSVKAAIEPNVESEDKRLGRLHRILEQIYFGRVKGR